MTKPMYAEAWSTLARGIRAHVQVFDGARAQIKVDLVQTEEAFYDVVTDLRVTKTPTGLVIEANAAAVPALLLGLQGVAGKMPCLAPYAGKDTTPPAPEPPCPGDSPIEQAFAKAWRALTGAYPQAQVQIGPYRVDFLINRTVIELDGHAYHSSKDQRGHDAKRDRFLQAQGYRVARFTGTEVHRDAAACARQALELCK